MKTWSCLVYIVVFLIPLKLELLVLLHSLMMVIGLLSKRLAQLSLYISCFLASAVIRVKYGYSYIATGDSSFSLNDAARLHGFPEWSEWWTPLSSEQMVSSPESLL